MDVEVVPLGYFNPGPPAVTVPGGYVAEDGVTQYVAEDGTTQYVQEH